MAERGFLGCRVHVEHRDQCRRRGADIGAHDQRNRVFEPEQALLRENDREPRGHRAGLHQGGKQATDEDCVNRVLQLGQQVDELGIVLQGLQRSRDQVEAEKHETEVKNRLAEHRVAGSQQRDDEAEDNDNRRECGQLEGDQLRRDRGADIRAENDTDAVLERQHAGIDQADGDYRGRGTGLDQARDQRADQHADDRYAGRAAEGLAEPFPGDFFDFARKIFQPENEQDYRGHARHQYMNGFQLARKSRSGPGCRELCPRKRILCMFRAAF